MRRSSDLYEEWNNTGCRYALWEDIQWDFSDRFFWDEEAVWAKVGNHTFLSTSELETWIFGDEGNKRSDRTPFYDKGLSPSTWLLNDLTSPPTFFLSASLVPSVGVSGDRASLACCG